VKATFLLNVRGRLMGEVGPYLSMAARQNTGFFASARMIFPVVEAVATVIYRKHSKERQPVRLLRALGIDYPNLVWEMYRHTLMHNDEMASAVYRGRTIRWGIRIGGGHSWARGHLHVDVRKIYDDLLTFLAREAAFPRSKSVHVWVGQSFRFNTGFAVATRAEARQLGGP